MPIVGYGSYQLSTSQAETLKAGFCHIDSAEEYDNEEGIGKGIKIEGPVL